MRTILFLVVVMLLAGCATEQQSVESRTIAVPMPQVEFSH